VKVIMNFYPKKKIALENEQYMENWLKDNEKILPNTLYGISKAIGWSFGQTRGTIKRLEEKKHNFIIQEEVIDKKNKKFKNLIALKNQKSHSRLKNKLKNMSISPVISNKLQEKLNHMDKLECSLQKIKEEKNELKSNNRKILLNLEWMMDFFQQHSDYLKSKITKEERKKFREIVDVIQEGEKH